MPDSIRVLHVDDDESYGELVADFLEREDERFVVESARGADDALDRVERERPDCVVSDYEMPGTDGIEFLESVREGHPELPFILFTGKGSEEIASDAISAGATDYLQKQSGSDQYKLLANRVENAVEQYRSGRQLRRERSRMRFALESTGAAIWTLDGATGEMEIQPPVCPLFDVEIDSFGAFLDQVHPEDRSRMRETVETARRGGEPYSVQFRFPDDGETRWAEMIGRTIHEDGDVSFQTGITRDITTQKEQKRRFETLTSNLPGMAYRCRNDPNWPMEDVRGDVSEFTGHTAAELEAGEVEWGADVIHPDDRSWVWTEVQSSLAPADPFELTYRIVTDDGDIRWVWERGRGIYGPEGELEAIEGFITDITDRKQRERQLRETNRRFQSVLDTVEAAIFIKDIEGRYQLMNPTCREILGVDPDADVTGLTDHDLLPDDVADRIREDDRRVLEHGEPVEIEEEIPTADGEQTRLTFKSPLYDETGELVGISAVSTDISDRKQRERRLERQNERFDRLASVISHDLQSPISTVRGRLELARETGDLDHVDRALSALERVEALREDLVGMLRSGEIVDDTEPVDVATAARGAWEGVNSPDDSLLDVAAEPTVEADPDATRRLLQNLLSNAVEHADGPTAIRVGPCDDGFYVEDDGPGIDAADRADVFVPGFSTKSGGTGMGMASVEQIVEEHGWEIAITDADELDGARFEITD